MNRTHFCQINVKPQFSRTAPNPSVWRRIGAKFRQFTTIAEEYPIRKYYFRSSKAYQDEKINHTKGKYWFSIHPFSNFQFFRQCIMSLVYVVAVILDQLDIAYLSKNRVHVNSLFDIAMLIVNVVAFFDCVCNFFTGFVSQTERVNINLATGYYKTAETATVLDLGSITSRYIKTFFFADIFSLANIIHICVPSLNGVSTGFYIFACFRHIRLIRFISVSSFVQIILTNIRIQQELFVVLLFIFWFAFLSIFFGSMFIYVPDIATFVLNEDRRTYLKQLQEVYFKANKELTNDGIILHSSYDAFCLLIIFETQNIDKTVEIYIIITSTMIIGNVLKIAVLLQLYSIFNRRYQSRLKFKTFMQEVKYMVANLNVSKQLALDVINYFDVKLKKEYFNESEIFNTLQRHMQYEIFAQSSMGLIRNCHLFRNLPNYFVVQLSLRLRCETYIPGVTVITVGEIATCMYFIATGTVAVFSADGTELCHLSDGEYVGEIGILQSTARVADVVTIEHCELYRLDIRDFQEVIKPNSKFYKRIYKIATKRMNVHVNTKEAEDKK